MSDLKKEVLAFLRENPVMSAAINGHPAPISTVLLYTISDDFVINFAVRSDSFKAKALNQNPQMSISNWKLNEMSIQATGQVSRVTDGDRVEHILDKLSESVGKLDGFWPPVLQFSESDYQVFELKISWMRKLDLTRKNIHDNGKVFADII